MRKILILLMAFVVIIGVTACTKKVESTPASSVEVTTDTTTETPERTIALVMKTLANPFFIEMEKGARKAETELGIHLIVKTGANETSIEEQIAIVEELIDLKVHAIVIAPGSSTDLIPVLKQAQEQGIVIVNIDNRLDPEMSKKIGLKDVPFISVDNEAGGYLCGKYLSSLIVSPTQVAIIEGIRGADNAEQRKNGAIRAFKENSNIEMVASETANWKIDEALKVVTQIYASNPNVGAIFCANDMMALGVVEYMTKSNRTDVLIGGYDALSEAKTAIQEGKMTVTINQQADVQGYTGIQYANDILDGKSVPSETLIDLQAVDAVSLKK